MSLPARPPELNYKRVNPEPQQVVHTASTWSRLFAKCVDGILLVALLYFGGFLSSLLDILKDKAEPKEILIPWSALIASFSLSMVYQFVFLSTMSTTPGKALFGLKVVSLDAPQAKRLSPAKASLRVIFESILHGLIAYISLGSALFRPDRRHFVDLIAGTQVIQLKPRDKAAEKRWLIGSIAILLGLFKVCTIPLTLNKIHPSKEGLIFKLGEIGKQNPAQSSPSSNSTSDQH